MCDMAGPCAYHVCCAAVVGNYLLVVRGSITGGAPLRTCCVGSFVHSLVSLPCCCVCAPAWCSVCVGQCAALAMQCCHSLTVFPVLCGLPAVLYARLVMYSRSSASVMLFLIIYFPLCL